MTGRAIGYAREVGALSLEQQIQKLKAAGCDPVYSDARTFDPALERPGMVQALAAAERGNRFMAVRAECISRKASEMELFMCIVRGRELEFNLIDEPEVAQQIYAMTRRREPLRYVPVPLRIFSRTRGFIRRWFG